MKNPNQNLSHKNQVSKKSIAARIAALGLAATIAPVGAINAGASQTHERTAAVNHYETVNDAIVAQDQLISRNIANQVPVHFTNTIAYNHSSAKKHFYIENPLSAIVSVGKDNKRVNLIGYIERKGSGGGPDVVMFVDSPQTTSMYHDNADSSSFRHENNVTFPDVAGAAYNLNVPINPTTGAAYLDQAGETSLIGYQYVAKK